MSLEFKLYKSLDEISGDFFMALHQLDTTDFPNPWTNDSFKSFLLTHEFLIVGVFKDNLLIGFSFFEVQVVDSFAHLLKIVVQKSSRGRNIGSQLLERSISILKGLNVNKIFLEVEQSNNSAIMLYEKFDFKRIHLNKNFYGNDRHALIMTRELVE